MPSLRESMAENGFESNDSYEFQVHCLLDSPTDGLRTLAIEGDCERRKTAFANALAHSLPFKHVLYHDFSDEAPAPEIILPPTQDELGREEPPIDPLDDIASHACALSEGESTILILDQLQIADFRDHIRIHRLIRDRRWLVRDAPYFANPKNLLLFLISEEPLYHALARASFRVWISRVSERYIVFRPADFDLGSDAFPLFAAIETLFRALGAAPTRGELKLILHDLQRHVRTADDLRRCLFGRCEGIERETLHNSEHDEVLGEVVRCLIDWLDTEQIVLGDD